MRAILFLKLESAKVLCTSKKSKLFLSLSNAINTARWHSAKTSKWCESAKKEKQNKSCDYFLPVCNASHMIVTVAQNFSVIHCQYIRESARAYDNDDDFMCDSNISQKKQSYTYSYSWVYYESVSRMIINLLLPVSIFTHNPILSFLLWLREYACLHEIRNSCRVSVKWQNQQINTSNHCCLVCFVFFPFAFCAVQ